jgi:NADH dehydrogenase
LTGTGGPARPRIVVVGAGFGGLWAARALARELGPAQADVLLLDRNNYHTFFPLLYQVAAAELAPSDIAYPIRGILRRTPSVAFRMAEVVGVDLDARTIDIGSDRIPYDRLVLAPGSVSHDFGVPGAAEHAHFLRWMDDAIPIRQQVLARLEAAAAEPDRERRRRLLTFVIVGGGPTGVEFAGALAEFVYGPARRDYPGVAGGEPRIVLLEATDRVLRTMPPNLSAFAADRLRRRRVEVRLDATVERIGPTEVLLTSEERIPTETIVWTAGIKGDPRVARWGLPTGRGGRVPVTPQLHLADRPEVYVVGDLALLEGENGQLPQVAQVAMQQGTRAARNIAASLEGRPLAPFAYFDYGVLAVIGRNAAVADVRGRTFTGFPAWVLWLAIHLVKLIGFRNRALVLVNWAWNYLFPRRSVRLILPEGGPRPD